MGSDEESVSCSSDRVGKGAGRAGRPRGKGRPKRQSRGARRKSEESEEWEDKGRVRERVNVGK